MPSLIVLALFQPILSADKSLVIARLLFKQSLYHTPLTYDPSEVSTANVPHFYMDLLGEY